MRDCSETCTALNTFSTAYPDLLLPSCKLVLLSLIFIFLQSPLYTVWLIACCCWTTMRWACLACSPPPPPSTSPTATWTTHMSCLASCPPPAPPSPTSTSATTSSVTLVFADFSSHPPLLFKSLIGLEITWKPESWPGKPIFYLIINLYFIVFERWSLHKRVRSVFYFPDLSTSSPWPTSFSRSLTLNQSRTSSLLWRKLSEGLLAPGSHHQQTILTETAAGWRRSEQQGGPQSCWMLGKQPWNLKRRVNPQSPFMESEKFYVLLKILPQSKAIRQCFGDWARTWMTIIRNQLLASPTWKGHWDKIAQLKAKLPKMIVIMIPNDSRLKATHPMNMKKIY